ncbi:hypothetical protein LTR28_010000 [Elasticomyces elasticus]|nr:hypothetical protein LTR28_010000 [Elasticomyces elasticus]
MSEFPQRRTRSKPVERLTRGYPPPSGYYRTAKSLAAAGSRKGRERQEKMWIVRVPKEDHAQRVSPGEAWSRAGRREPSKAKQKGSEGGGGQEEGGRKLAARSCAGITEYPIGT